MKPLSAIKKLLPVAFAFLSAGSALAQQHAAPATRPVEKPRLRDQGKAVDKKELKTVLQGEKVDCTPEMLEKLELITEEVMLRAVELCGDPKTGELIENQIAKDESGQTVDCRHEMQIFNQITEQYEYAEESGLCPIECQKCVIDKPAFAQRITHLNKQQEAKVAAEKEKADQCTPAEAEAASMPKCLKDVISAFNPAAILLNGIQGQAAATARTAKIAAGCGTEIIAGVVYALVDTIDLVKVVGTAIKDWVIDGWNWITNKTDKAADANHAGAQQGPGILKRLADDPGGTMKEMTAGLAAMIDKAVRERFGCPNDAWSGGIPHVGECLRPMRNWTCASCEQKVKAVCGSASYVISQIVSDYVLTLGIGFAVKQTVNAVKVGAAASKVVIKVGSKIPGAVAAARATAKPFVATARVVGTAGTITKNFVRGHWLAFKTQPTIYGAMQALRRARVTGKLALHTAKRVPVAGIAVRAVSKSVGWYFHALNKAAECGFRHGYNLDRNLVKAGKAITELPEFIKATDYLDDGDIAPPGFGN